MGSFSRNTIIEALSRIHNWSHADIDDLALRFDLDHLIPESPRPYPKKKAIIIAQHLINNPDQKGPNGAPLALEVIEFLITGMQDEPESEGDDEFGFEITLSDSNEDARIRTCLLQDGYIIRGGRLLPKLPEEVELDSANDELRILLNKHDFTVAQSHLEQAFAAHTRNDWAAANGQLRTSVESLFDSIFYALHDGATTVADSSNARREALANMNPPFFRQDLNELEPGRGKGFIPGFWQRLHAEGSHPGLSDREDSTFRLHLVVLVIHHFMRRFESYLKDGEATT